MSKKNIGLTALNTMWSHCFCW